MERLDGDRPLRQASRGRDGQPSAIQLGGQRLEGVVADGVGSERPADQVGPLCVEGGDVSLAALGIHGGVAVAQGCATDTATVPSLLTHALLDLVRQVERVELSDRAHDAVQQHAARCLVDVLAGGDEADAEVVEALIEGDIVSPVAGQPVQLVDDDVVDGLAVSAGVFQVAQHRLEGWAPGRGVPGAPLAAAAMAPVIVIDYPAGDQRPPSLHPLSHRLKAELIKTAEDGQIRTVEGSVVHVGVFQMGSVTTPIIGRPRPHPASATPTPPTTPSTTKSP